MGSHWCPAGIYAMRLEEVTKGECNVPSLLMDLTPAISAHCATTGCECPHEQIQGASPFLHLPSSSHPISPLPVLAIFLKEWGWSASTKHHLPFSPPPAVIRLPSQHATEPVVSRPPTPGTTPLSSSCWSSQQPWTQLASLLPEALSFPGFLNTMLSGLPSTSLFLLQRGPGSGHGPPSLPYLHRRKMGSTQRKRGSAPSIRGTQ